MNPPPFIPWEHDPEVIRRKRFWKRSIWLSLVCSVGGWMMGLHGVMASLHGVFLATDEDKLVASKLRPDLTEFEFDLMMVNVYGATGTTMAGLAFAWMVVSVVRFLRLRRNFC